MVTVTVSNAAELITALNGAVADTVIELNPGNYNNLYIAGKQIPQLTNNSDVTITSKDPNNPATITKMTVVDVKNLTFDNINFDYSANSGTSVSNRAFVVQTSDNVTFQNSVFDGDLATGGTFYENGYGTGIALGIHNTDNVNVLNNTFYTFHKGVVIENGNNIKVANNDISGMSSDGINFSGVNNAVMEGNHLHDFLSHINTTAHKDMIQVFANKNGSPSSNVTIKDNILNSGTGDYTHSILIKTENGSYHQDFVIQDNLLHTSFTHGITLNYIKGVVVQNNTILHNPDASVEPTQQYVPKIHILDQTQNVVVSDNITHAVTGNNWSGSGNLIVQNTNPNQPNYYGDLFVNALVGGTATIDDLAPLPGGIIEQTGVGADLSQNGTAQTLAPNTGPAALLLSNEGTELDKGKVDFDISQITDSGTPVNSSGVKVNWDFGDGTSGSGLSASHQYTKAGTYTAKATITLADGTKFIETKALNVKTPVIIATDLQNGPADQSDLVNAVSTKGSVSYVQDQGSRVAKLGDNGAITYARTPELFDNSAYTLLADFRKDNASDDGKIISFTHSFVVQVKSNMISVSVTTDKGTQWIHTSADVANTNWHKLALTFSGTGGTAELYLDGNNIGTISGLKGATQVGNKLHDFHIGSHTGGSFDGLIDNVNFLAGDLSASEIKSLHSGQTTVAEILGTATSSNSGSTPTTTNTQQTQAPVETETTNAPVSEPATPTTNQQQSSQQTDQQTATPAPSTDTGANGSGATLIASDFEGGFKDQSATANKVINKGAQIISDNGSKVVKLTSQSLVTYQDTPDLFGNKSYTVMADFRKDNASDDGKLITFVGSFVIQVKKDMLSVSVTTDKGTKWIHTSADVNDTKDHKIALTFDSGSGRAELFLDGQSVGAITGLKGATQVGNKSHDFHIGSPWGGSFDGLVDNVTFITTDLSAAEIKSLHSGTASTSNGGNTGTTSTPVADPAPQVTDTGSSPDTGAVVTNTGASFSYMLNAKKTKIVLDKAAQEGIIDQAYLSGDTASSFNIKVIDTMSTAPIFNNSLGVYEFDKNGNIVDVRVIDKDAQTGGNFQVTGVEKGHNLGFFIIQDGYNRLDNSVLNASDLSLVVKSGNIHLKQGNTVFREKVWVSHDKNLNVDNHQHVASMDNPTNNGAIIGFEDQYKGDRANDLSDVVFEVTAVGADELSFA